MKRVIGVLLASVVLLVVAPVLVAAGTDGPLRVFTTTATTNGTPTNARAGMGAMCKAEDTTAHFCSLQEIANAVKTSGVEFQVPFSRAWADNLGDGLTEADWWNNKNCSGWTSANSGQVIDQNAENAVTSACSSVLPVACCSWSPTASPPTALFLEGLTAKAVALSVPIASVVAAVLTVLALNSVSWWRRCGI